jgi:hypothetical protein
VDEEDGRRTGEGAALSASPARRALLRSARPAAAAAAVVAVLLAGATARARDDPASGGTSASGVPPDRVQLALAWIAAKEQNGGIWGQERDTRVADTALSVLALMAGGNTLGPGVPDRDGLVKEPTKRGPYADKVEEGIGWLAQLANRPTDPPGYISADQFSKMHGHGLAMLALATACGNLGANRIDVIQAQVRQGLSPAKLPYADRVRLALERAVRLTESAQDLETGGWMYSPQPSGHEGSMTVTQISGLRAAMAAGVAVNGTVMKHAIDYVRKSQNRVQRENFGGFAYQINDKGRVSYALTAAALTTFFGLGRYGEQDVSELKKGEPTDKQIIEDGLSFMDRKFHEEAYDTNQRWYYYRLFYAVQALFLSGDSIRIYGNGSNGYWPQIRDHLLQYNQEPDGSFSTSVDADRSPEYCTAMGCLILEIPMETLPIFQRR